MPVVLPNKAVQQSLNKLYEINWISGTVVIQLDAVSGRTDTGISVNVPSLFVNY